MAIVLVNPTQQAFLRSLAVERNKGKRNNKRGWGRLTAEDNHYIGLLGEYAASRVLDGYDYDRACYGASGDGGNADLTGPAGGINVKTRTRRGYDFALTGDSLEGFKADAAVLVWPAPEYEDRLATPQDTSISLDVVGIVSYADFAAKAVHKDFGYGLRLVLEHQHFIPIRRPLWSHEVQRFIKERR